MSDENIFKYTCDVCNYVNVWMRDEIEQRGRKVVFRGNGGDDDEKGEVYSLPCKSPKKPACSGRRRVRLDPKG
jgi:hypothetical protein